MIKWWISGAAVIILLAAGISIFLTPNNIAKCGSSPSDTKGCMAVDAIIAVSGGDTTARAESAINLYKNGWASKIIFSGAAADPESPSNAAVMRKLAIKNGVPENAIIIEETSKTTKENASNTAKILSEKGIKTAIITTSPYHQRRALIEFTRAAPNVQFLSSPAVDHTWDFWWIKPTGWWLGLSELVNIVMLSTKGSI